MNKKLFGVQMVLNDETQDTVAEALGVARGTLNRKINEYPDPNGNRYMFNQKEISALIERWKLTPEDVVAIFFNRNVS